MARDRNDIASGLDRLLLGFAREALAERAVGAALEVPEVAEDLARDRREPLGERAIGLPRALDRRGVDLARAAVQLGRHVRGRLAELHVALTLLLGVVEREAVQHPPDEPGRERRELRL